MTAQTNDRPASPYLMAAPPESTGRVLLATGFAHYCGLHWGYDPSEVLEAFQGGGDALARQRVAFAARLLGGVLARGFVRAWTRAIGGGEPVELRASVWEIDDFSDRFAASAMDPARPFDRSAARTHWVFVDLDDWNAMLVASVEDGARWRPAVARTPEARSSRDTVRQEVDKLGVEVEDRLIRMPEVKRLTGLSRSTINRRMKAGRFPKSTPLSPNITVWRAMEVAAWVADPY